MYILKAIVWGMTIGMGIVFLGILFFAFPLTALFLFIIVLGILAIRKRERSMNQDTVQINEILCVLKRYYDKYPQIAPVLFREDTAYRVQKLVDKLQELEEKEELVPEIVELRGEIESLNDEIEDLQAERAN